MIRTRTSAAPDSPAAAAGKARSDRQLPTPGCYAGCLPLRRLLPIAVLLLAACAGHQTHRDGMSLLEQGKYEEALGKLEEAARDSPDDISYRTDLIRTREQVTNKLLEAANAERVAERFDRAKQIFERVGKIDPNNARAKVGLDGIAMDRRHAAVVADAQALLKKNDLGGATEALKTVLVENPNNSKAILLQRQLNEQQAKELAAVPTLLAKFNKPISLQFRDANLKMVFESIAKTSGINILLDKDIKNDLKTSIFVKDVSVVDSLDLILMQNQLEKKVLSDNTLFIYPNIPAKTKDYQDLKVRSFHLVNADAKQMQTMIKTILKTKDLFIHEKTNSLIMRDTPEAVRLAEKMIEDQDVADSEVMLEVEVLEVTRDRLTDLGITYPDQLTISPAGTGTGTGSGILINDLKHLNSKNLLVSPIPSLTLHLQLQDSDTKVLASPRIRARNHEKAKILIGDRVPVITNSVTPVSTGTPVVTGNVQYLDVGLKLDVEPDIHPDGEVGIKVSMEVSSIVKEVNNTVSGSLAYQIGTRTASTVLRLRDGETQVLAGLIDDEDRRTATKIPGLGQLPMLGRLFSDHHGDAKRTEIVLSITPHLVGSTSFPDARTIEFWTGTETTLRSSPLSLRQTGIVAMSASATAAQPMGAAKVLPVLPSLRGTTPPAIAVSKGGAEPAGAGPPMALSWRGPAQAKMGDKFTLTLNTRSGQPVHNVGVLVSFDPTALKAVEAVEGDLLRQHNLPSNFSRDIDQGGGQVTVELAQTSADGGSGAGSITAITFEVLAANPQSQITVTRVTASGPTGDGLPVDPPAAYNMVLGP